VGTRISWGAILGGGLVAFAIYFALTILGAAVGLSISDRMRPPSLHTALAIWTILTLAVAVFVGGVMTSYFTVGENKVEAIFYGVIMWAFLVTLLLAFGAAGAHGGFGGMVHMTYGDGTAMTNDWEAGAREAGVPAQVIADWRTKTGNAATNPDQPATPATQQESLDAAKRVAWWTFAGAWISMLAAAAGAWLGAGPTFRLVETARPEATSRIATPA